MAIECCWRKEQIAPDECSLVGADEPGLLLDRKQRFLQRCLKCPRFLEELGGPPGAISGMTELLPYLVEELLELRSRAQAQQGLLDTRTREIRFLHEVGLVLQTSFDKDEVIAMALTAITAGQGFGLNRAILLLVDREQQNLQGYFAVGPRRPEDAGPIWKELEDHDFTLREMARQFFEQKMATERERFRDLLELLSVPLARTDHLFVETLNGQVSRRVPHLWQEPGLDASQREALGVNTLVMVPLVSQNRRIGLLLADNIINGRPITADDLQSLETFALPVAFAIERALLYERLQLELARATEANRRLQEQQEQILRMEKMALVGSIAANIAHSIRNPLTIIGGFARTLNRETPPADPKRRQVESIIRESRRLEEALEEVLAYSESLHPTLDLWDLNQLVAQILAGLRDELELAGISFRLDLAPALPKIRFDYRKIGYCLRTLIGNALDRLPRGEQLQLATIVSENNVRLVLHDDGPLLTPAILAAAATPFAANTPPGTGLGLSLCARILEAHRAGFEIESRAGSGTTFTIHLATTGEGRS